MLQTFNIGALRLGQVAIIPETSVVGVVEWSLRREISDAPAGSEQHANAHLSSVDIPISSTEDDVSFVLDAPYATVHSPTLEFCSSKNDAGASPVRTRRR